MEAVETEPSEHRDYFECQLRAAAQWIEHARDILFRSLDNSSNFSILRSGPLYTGKKGLSRERWDFWEARLRALAEGGTLTEETASICRKAAQQMAEMAATADVSDEAAPAETATAEAEPAEVIVDTATADTGTADTVIADTATAEATVEAANAEATVEAATAEAATTESTAESTAESTTTEGPNERVGKEEKIDKIES